MVIPKVDGAAAETYASEVVLGRKKIKKR